MIRRYYGVDPLTLTWDNFQAYLSQIIKIRKLEAGINPNEEPEQVKKKLSVDEFVEKVLAGELDVDARQDKIQPSVKPPISEEERRAEEQRVLRKLGLMPSAPSLSRLR